MVYILMFIAFAGYGEGGSTPETMPLKYETKKDCNDAGVEALTDFNRDFNTEVRKLTFVCVRGNR